jgi:hypothetical protein
MEERRVFEVTDIRFGITYKTPLGAVDFVRRGENVTVNIGGYAWAIYGGADRTVGFINKKLRDAEDLHGRLVCRL